MANATRNPTPGVRPPFDRTANAPLNNRRAVASLKRLSPFRTVVMFREIETELSTAVAATASGGATMAPSAIAAAIGRPANLHPIHATSAVVTSTANTASAIKGSPEAASRPERIIISRIENGRSYEQGQRGIRFK